MIASILHSLEVPLEDGGRPAGRRAGQPPRSIGLHRVGDDVCPSESVGGDLGEREFPCVCARCAPRQMRSERLGGAGRS